MENTLSLRHIQGGAKQDNFRFYVPCGVCGEKMYGSKHFRLLLKLKPYAEYAKRRTLEKVRSNYVNRCPHCGKYVCNACFLIAEEGDYCLECAKENKLKGRTVGSTPETQGKTYDFTKAESEEDANG